MNYPGSHISACVAITVLVSVVGVGGCGPPPMPEPGISTARLSTHLSRLAVDGGGDQAAALRRVHYAADRMEAANLQPARWESYLIPFGDSVSQLPGWAGAASSFHVMGYLAGRNANVSSEMVLLSSDLESPGAAAALEAVRALEVEALRGLVPEATVGVILWGPSRSAVDGARDFLASPPWALEAVSSVLHVALDTVGVGAVRRVWEDAGVPFEVVGALGATAAAQVLSRPLSVDAAVYRLAHATYAATRRAASEEIVEAGRSTSLSLER
jgi:hypothetical protein